MRGLVDCIMLLAILWLRLPAAFGAQPPNTVRALALVPLVIGIAVLLPLRRANKAISLLGVIVGILLLLIVVALFRGESAGAYETIHEVTYESLGIGLLVGFGYLYLASALRASERDRRLFIVCCTPAVYVAINVLLNLGKVHVGATAGEPTSVINAGTPAQLLGLVGIHSSRVLFPLANGINNFGDIAGVALAISTILAVKTRGRQRKVSLLLLAASAYGLLATDARGALVFSVAAVILVLLFGHRRSLTWLPLIMPFTTFITTFLLKSIANTPLVSIFSRSGDDLITATNRTTIWEGVSQVLSHPAINQLYGWGIGGQISSGASVHYDFLFFGAARPDQYTAHNFALQTILDVGYVGLIVFVLVFLLAARRLQKMLVGHGSPVARALLGSLVFLIFAGATDGAPSIYTPETLYFLFLASTSIAAARISRAELNTRAARNDRKATTITGTPVPGALAPSISGAQSFRPAQP